MRYPRCKVRNIQQDFRICRAAVSGAYREGLLGILSQITSMGWSSDRPIFFMRRRCVSAARRLGLQDMQREEPFSHLQRARFRGKQAVPFRHPLPNNFHGPVFVPALFFARPAGAGVRRSVQSIAPRDRRLWRLLRIPPPPFALRRCDREKSCGRWSIDAQ